MVVVDQGYSWASVAVMVIRELDEQRRQAEYHNFQVQFSNLKLD